MKFLPWSPKTPVQTHKKDWNGDTALNVWKNSLSGDAENSLKLSYDLIFEIIWREDP